MTRLRPVIGVVAFAGLATLSGCSPITFDGEPCGPEFRSVQATADVRGSTTTVLVSVSVTIGEIRGDSVPGALLFMATANGSSTGEPLKGHVSHAALLDAGGAALHELPTRVGYGNVVVIPDDIPIRDASTVAALRDRLLNGSLILLLRTDLPDMPELRTPLPRARDSGFQRARCV
ncbi:MAG: hypothetical protein JWN79_1497 [Gemmatimonadetes bacterium]|jgi:hypothetical protein|nr:hypothetical protein [Gemmatimonadota bacterium]